GDPAIAQKLRFGGLDVSDAEVDVIDDAEGAVAGARGNVEHKFDSVGAVGDLQGDPVIHAVLHAAMPGGTKGEKISEEVVGSAPIGHDVADMNDLFADLRHSRIRGRTRG